MFEVKHILEAEEMGLGFLLEQLKFRVREKHGMGKIEGSSQNGYVSKGAPTVHISEFEAICLPEILRMGLDPFLEQEEPEVENFWQNNSRVPGMETNIAQGAYVSGTDIGFLWEERYPTVKLGEGFWQAGFTSGFSLPVLPRSSAVSKSRSPTVAQFALFLLAAAGCAGAAWGDFANNLGSDLAPLLTLFGEQVTRQYLSESYSLLDSFVFALAPLGIITGIVAAIRVGGNSNFRSLIGRATESRGTVEADLMSSTSADVCELWNGQGIVRVLGSPVLLQLVCVASQKSGAKAGIYTLPETIEECHYKSLSLSAERNPDTEAFLDHQNPPSLSLNASINIERRHSIARVIALVGILLQSGVFVFAGLIQYKPGILRGNEPIAYGFPMFLAGTLSLTVGMFLCAQVVESSTKETVYKPSEELISGNSETKDRNTIIWLQQGGQIVGDQLFESFARRRPAAMIMTSEKSETDRNILVVIAVSTALFGFIAQFVGLRAMHATVTVTRLGIVLIMTALRSFAHMQREHRNDIKNPKQVDGHELDWLAKELNGCESWEVMPQFDKPLSVEDSSNPAMDVVKSRARLAALSGDWNLENRNKIKVLQSVIEETINHVFAKMTIKDESKENAEFQWHFPVKAKFEGEELIFSITLNLRREKDDSGGWKLWSADVSELEAVFCLWASTLTEAKREGGMPTKYIRLLGPATDESKVDYRLWVHRGTPYSEALGPLAIPTAVTSDEDQYFGWAGDSKNTNGPQSPTTVKYICVDYKGGLENLCAQDLYGWFIFSLVSVIEEAGGSTTRRSNDPDLEESATAASDIQSNGWDHFRLINSNLNLLATFFSESGLGTIEEAYFYLVPAFRLEGSLLFPHEAYDEAGAEAKRLENNGLWEQALEIYWWLYHNSRKTRASRLHILLSTFGIRGFLRRLAEKLSVESSEEDSNGNLARIWDAVYSGWEMLSEASEDRVASLLKLSITCPKAKPEKDQRQVFLLALETAQKLDVRVLRTADIVLDLARFGLGNGFLDDAEALAKRVWAETIEPWHGREKTRNKEAGKLLLDIRKRKGISLIHDEYKFLTYLSDPEPMQLAAGTGISTRASTSDIAKGQVPIELLVIRGSKTPLQWAAKNGQENIVRQLLKSSVASDEAPTIDSGQSSLEAAARAGHEGIVKLLLGAKVEVNAQPAKRNGRTALQAAAEGGHESIMKLLLEAKAEVNAAPKAHGRTALQAAAAGGHESIVKLLLEAKAEVNAAPAEYEGRTALQAAAAGGHESTVKLLLEAKAEVNAAPAEYEGRTALQAAAAGGHESTVKLLLEAKAEVNAAPEADGRTALQAAAEGGHESIVKLLLEAKAEVNAAPAGFEGRTALQAAAEGGHESTVKLLLEAKAKVNATTADDYGRTALQAAAEGGHESIVKLLLEAKAEVNAAPAENYGRTALQAAAERGHESTVKLLLEAKAEVNAAPAGFEGRTALQAAAEGGHESTVKLLLEAKAKVNAAPVRNCGRTALQAATAGGHESIVKLLLEAKAEVNAAPAGSLGLTALQAAAEGGHESIVKLLLEAKAEVNAAPAADYGRTALQAAAEGGHESIVQLLLKAKAEVNAAPAADGRTALQAAAAGGYESIVRLLLKAKAEVNAAPAADGRTALQAAAEGGHESIVKLLLKAKAEVNAAPAADGRTALQAAAAGGYESIVKLLLEAKAEVNAAPAGNRGRTALQAAVAGGHESIVKLLLEAKAEVNAAPAGSLGLTALQAAAAGGHESIVKLLLEAKAEVNAAPAGNCGRTALQAAAEGGHESIVKLLLEAKAEVNTAPAADGQTALQAAAEGGHESIVKLLLEAKARVNATPAGDYGRTALQAATAGGHEDIVKLLLDTDVKVS